jgi:hypothetical protein
MQAARTGHEGRVQEAPPRDPRLTGRRPATRTSGRLGCVPRELEPRAQARSRGCDSSNGRRGRACGCSVGAEIRGIRKRGRRGAMGRASGAAGCGCGPSARVSGTALTRRHSAGAARLTARAPVAHRWVLRGVGRVQQGIGQAARLTGGGGDGSTAPSTGGGARAEAVRGRSFRAPAPNAPRSGGQRVPELSARCARLPLLSRRPPAPAARLRRPAGGAVPARCCETCGSAEASGREISGQ